MHRTIIPLFCLLAFASAAQAQSVITAKTFIPPGFTTAALGNGATDDTAVLQADINYALAHQCTFQIEPGTYKITQTLVLSEPIGTTLCGFMMTGMAGPNRNGGLAAGGVSIAMVSSSQVTTVQPAVFEIGSGAFRDIAIQNISFISTVASCGTAYGVEFANTGFSHALFFDCAVVNCATAFGILQDADGEANGEAVDLTECIAGSCNCFYSNDSGQAYGHNITNCGGTINNGGTVINIGAPNLGFNLNVVGSGWTMLTGPLRNTFLENNLVSGPINIVGGRNEHVDTVLHYGGGSYGDTANITFNGVWFTDYSGNFPLIDGTLNGYGCEQWVDSFNNCEFCGRDGLYPAISVVTSANDHSANYFTRCTFNGFSNNITNLAATAGIAPSQCRYTTGTSSVLTVTP